ncbi:MAG: cupin domain-containing protein [Microcystaceae cyanobacterium]
MKIIDLSQLPYKQVSHNPAIQKQVMIAAGEIPHLTNFAQAILRPSEVSNGHFHKDMHEVFFILSGEGIMCIDGQDYSLTVGTCIAVSPHETHELRNNGTENLIVTYFGIQVD